MQPDAELGWIPRAGVRVEYPPFKAAFRTNENGLRGPAVSMARMPGRQRVVVLGDSFAWGHGVPEGSAFCEVLARRMPDAEFVNLGVPGFDLRRERTWFERVGHAYRPDVVIVALCQNDIRDFDGPAAAGEQANRASTNRASIDSAGEHAAATAGCPDEGLGLFREARQFLVEHSRACALARHVVNSNRSLSRLAVALRLKDLPGGFELLDDNLRAALRDYPPPVERAMAQADADLAALLASIRSVGAEPLVALVPALQAVDADALNRTLAYTRYQPAEFEFEKPHKIFAAMAEANGAAVVDPLALFRAAHADGRSLYLPGDLHFNGEGHALFAGAIEPKLRAMLAGIAERTSTD